MLNHKKKKLKPDSDNNQVKIVPDALASPIYAMQPNNS